MGKIKSSPGPDRISIYIDGAARGQGVRKEGGDAALGVAIFRKGDLIGQFARGLGTRTNNEAEYEALIAALLICWNNSDLIDPVIYSDSLIVVNQVNNTWRCNVPNLQSLLLTVQELNEVVRFKLEHIRRDEGAIWVADQLANLFLDKLLGNMKGGKQ